VRYSEHFQTGADLFRTVCDMDLEGIVAERKDGRYTPAETCWVKIKNSGYSQGEGRR
jgi:ATP-dependent DNA ligase